MEKTAKVVQLKTQLVKEGHTRHLLAETDLMTLRIHCYAPGIGENALHAHTKEDHIFLVLDGAAQFTRVLQIDLTVRNARNCPPPILGHAHLESGRLHERAGRRDDAINAYRTAATLFGAASDTRSAAQRALDRIAR